MVCGGDLFPCHDIRCGWVAARYFGVLMGWEIVGPQVMTLSGLFLVGSYVINALAPKLAGRLQVTTTAAKLIPLFLMAIFGTIFRLEKRDSGREFYNNGSAYLYE